MKAYMTSSATFALDSQWKDTLFWATTLFFPNALLSWILYAYISSSNDLKGASTLCISSLIGGVFTQGSIYAYFLWDMLVNKADLSFVISGFPFTYFVGTMIGFTIALFIVAGKSS